ncbi:N-acetylmuramoyl-L-alanine amidase [Actinomadura bangladeshensis]|jgi:N-acetylmuramoyl-L-alanine amidase|uniref:N-acetylmuramoyl-L-alanine amidase n=2 Tax=Actinomadura bangladeshensis TaxID=453573 RepID=A0A6L9QE12_9ACTN|nr:N-acetylmuramoyl-L-alanine amidase [Actinomadura bangladeshensis]NEA23226.1 N-acetylmuramoyl-L-alanine amidase [Actinomadura bangladeshensis]
MVAGLALCLGALTACNDSSGASTADPATPPAAGAPSPSSSSADRTQTSAEDGAASLAGKVVVIDPGHNGGNAEHPSEINKQVKIGNGSKACDTTGTETKAGYAEHAFTWDVSKRLAKLLRARGAKVTLTRKDDKGVGPCITERAAVGNELKADAAISIHADGAASSGHGFHIIEPISIGRNADMVTGSARLGKALRDAYHDGTGIPYSNYLGKNAIDRRDDLGGLNMSKVPKVFIECGNMQNKGDAAKLSSAPFRQRIADSLAKGFENYLT